MTSDEKLLMDLARLKRENPQWFNVMCQAAELPDDKLHELVKYVTAIVNSKESANR